MESLVALHFEDLKRKKVEAWNLCHEELLAVAHGAICARDAWFSSFKIDKEAIEHESIKILYQKVDRLASPEDLIRFLGKVSFRKALSEIRKLNKLESVTKTDEKNDEYEAPPQELVYRFTDTGTYC